MKKTSKSITIPIFLFVYERDGLWRGVAHPFDLCCESKSKEEAKAEIEERVKSYVDLLYKRNFPEKWLNVDFSDSFDKRMFEFLKENVFQKKVKDSYYGREVGHYSLMDAGQFISNNNCLACV